MKRFLVFSSFIVLGLCASSQERAPVGPTFKCKANCLFTSCEIECSANVNSGAVCSCWFGIAQCYCASIQSFRVIQTEDQRNNLVLFTYELEGLKSAEGKNVASAVSKIRDILRGSLTAETHEEYRQLVQTYRDNAEKLSGSDRSLFDQSLQRANQRAGN